MSPIRYFTVLLGTCLIAFTIQVHSRPDSCMYFGQLPPGDTARLFAPELFNNPEGYHSSPAFTNDLKGAYFSPMSRMGTIVYLHCKDQGNPEKIEFDNLMDAGDPYLASGNNTLYFLSFQALKDDPVIRERIWFSKRKNNQWEHPAVVNPIVYKHPTHWQFTVARNKNLYFTSEIGDKSEHGIYVSQFRNDQYEEPERLPASINATNTELTPYISPEESYIIFARKTPPDARTDLFIAFRNDNGSWGTPVRLPDCINSNENDLCPLISPDGQYLFFLSTRSGKSRIYWVRAFFLENFTYEKY